MPMSAVFYKNACGTNSVDAFFENRDPLIEEHVNMSMSGNSYMVVLSSACMEERRENLVVEELCRQTTIEYAHHHTAKWMAPKVADGLLDHSRPVGFYIPSTIDTGTTDDLVPLSRKETVDLLCFMLSEYYAGRNGYDQLKRKLLAIEKTLVRIEKYTAENVRERLFWQGPSPSRR